MNYKTSDTKFDSFLINMQKYFLNDKNVTLFQKRNTIKITDFQNIKYVVKSFKIPHLFNRIVYRFFRDSKAKRSYNNSLRLISLGINTPKPIGYVEFPSLLLFKESYYVSDFFDYDFEIRAVFKDKEFENRDALLKSFINFTYDLHNKGVYHIDYSPGNVLVKKIDENYIFYIIDVNRMKFLEFDVDLRVKSMSKLTSDRVDNDLMIGYYSEISNINLESLQQKYNFYLEKQAQYLQNKKRLKKIKS